MNRAPKEGRVLGIDVGFSATKKTTCICVLAWAESTATFAFKLATSDLTDRHRALAELSLSPGVSGIAVDGPLRRGLRIVSHYRAAEAILSRGVLQKRGKPGQTSSPVGQQLHRHATELANLALESVAVGSATHEDPIHEKSVVEAFPNMYLAALVAESDMPVLARDASDRYWQILVDDSDCLLTLISHLLHGRRVTNELGAIRNHEHRAGVVCALTALSVVSGDYVAVGDPVDGDIFLPAQTVWGRMNCGLDTWLEPVLRSNLHSVRRKLGCHPNHRQARIVTSACR